MAEIQTGQG